MNCPRCTMLLGLLAAAIVARQPETTTISSFTTGMRSVWVEGFQLHYTRNVSEAEAERIATWILRTDLPSQFPGPMRLDHTEASARLDVMGTEADTQKSVMVERVRLFAARLSEDQLKGASVDVYIWSSSSRIQDVIRPRESDPFFYN